MTPWILATIYTPKGHNQPELSDYMPKKPSNTKDDNASAQIALKAALKSFFKSGS